MKKIPALLFALSMWIFSGIASPAATDETQEEKLPSIQQRDTAIEKAMERGVSFLRKTQGKEGAWGSHDPVVIDNAKLGFGILNFGCHDGVRTACTAICAKALLLYPHRNKEDNQALDKAVRYLLRNWNLAYDPGNAFNTWGYCYSLDFLTTLYARSEGKAYQKELRSVIPKLIRGLRRMQVADGGWAYYTSVMLEGASLSFNTASILLNLMKARDLGFDVPKGMISDAGKVLKTQVLPNKNIIYGTYLKYSGDHALEDLSCVGRNQVGGLALHKFDKTYTRKDLIDQSGYFARTVDYIEKTGNKRIIPHRDAPQNISGYFLYYGCYYTAEVLYFLGPDGKEKNWDRLLKLILENQEEEGSWWDTICYDYGDKWGTGFALLCLEYYLASRILSKAGLVGKDTSGKDE